MNNENELWNTVKSEYTSYCPPLQEMLQQVSDDIVTTIKTNGIKCTSKYRVKERDSYYSKLKSLHKSGDAEIGLNDLLGMRIVVHFIDEVEQIVDLISEKYSVIEKEKKSDNLSFREFSYDSTHMLIANPNSDLPYVNGNNPVIEIQVRTTLQDAWAEVEHELIYKSNMQYHSDLIKRKMAALNASLTLSDIIFQEIKEYQQDMVEHKNIRSQQMHEKASLLTEDEYEALNSTIDETSNRASSKKAESVMAEALRAHNAGKYQHSIDLYSEAIELKPTQRVLSIIYNHKGMAHFMCSQYATALDDFTRAIECDTENYRAFGNRAIVHKLYKSYDEAIADFNASLEIRYNQPDLLLHLSKAYFEDNQQTLALHMVNLVLDSEPNNRAAQKLQLKVSRTLIP